MAKKTKKQIAADLEAKRAQQREYYHARMQDPAKREAYNTYMREYQAKRRADDPEYAERSRLQRRKSYWIGKGLSTKKAAARAAQGGVS